MFYGFYKYEVSFTYIKNAIHNQIYMYLYKYILYIRICRDDRQGKERSLVVIQVILLHIKVQQTYIAIKTLKLHSKKLTSLIFNQREFYCKKLNYSHRFNISKVP